MEIKKKSASKEKASRKKSKSSEKKVKTEDVEMDEGIVKTGATAKPNLEDVKNRATIKAHMIDNVSVTQICFNY